MLAQWCLSTVAKIVMILGHLAVSPMFNRHSERMFSKGPS